MLHVPHVVEEQFTVAHLAIREGTGLGNPGFCHYRHHDVQLFAAMLEVAEQYLFAVAGPRHDDLVLKFTAIERCRRMELGFAFRREIHVEEEKRVISQVPKREPPLTGPHRFRTGFDRVGQHVDRSMKLLPNCRSPKVDHVALRLAARSLRNLDTFSETWMAKKTSKISSKA